MLDAGRYSELQLNVLCIFWNFEYLYSYICAIIYDQNLKCLVYPITHSTQTHRDTETHKNTQTHTNTE